jgi:large subunit ribosomal protein L21
MFAVIKTGGKQYRVAKDDVIVVEKLEAEAGKSVSFGDVLMVADGANVSVGAPLVKGASVTGEVVEQRKGEKVKVFKKRRRNTYRRKRGHRQNETVVRITAVAAG